MTTSGVTAWSLTARELVTAALRDARILASGDDPTGDELDDCLVRLNGMLKTMSTQGNLFRDAETTATITAGDPTVTLAVDVRDVSAVRQVISATNERPLFAWTRAQYVMLPNKAAVGNPSVYYLSRGVGAPELSVWPVPSSNITLKIDYSRIADTVTDPAETIDLPSEWQQMIYKNLAVECADLFGANLSPRYIQGAEALYQRFLDSDRPDYYTFEADSAYC